jgi:hypothetical protein
VRCPPIPIMGQTEKDGPRCSTAGKPPIAEIFTDALAPPVSANFGHRTGSAPSLGYQARDRKLVIVESESKIASSSAAMPNSARYELLKDELEARSVTGESWTSAPGRLCGGCHSRGALYPMPQNRIYRGKSEHSPIIDRLLWDVVQACSPATPPSATPCDRGAAAAALPDESWCASDREAVQRTLR